MDLLKAQKAEGWVPPEQPQNPVTCTKNKCGAPEGSSPKPLLPVSLRWKEIGVAIHRFESQLSTHTF